MKPMTHYEFRERIALAWMNPDKYWPQRFGNKTAASSGPTEAAAGLRKRDYDTSTSSVTYTSTSSVTSFGSNKNRNSLNKSINCLRK